MGFNLFGYRVVDNKKISLSANEWDSQRHAYDKEFAYTEGFEWVYLPAEYPQDTEIYARPKFPFRAIEWIHQNIPEEVQSRYLNILDLMNEDQTIYFYFSN
ncbi:MAG TPA: hypothetical protein DGG95_18090 [Cytophagales bacterium]|jgi:hypothetical protein|nr:hypothetical protein [Cytophagales bacterium]